MTYQIRMESEGIGITLSVLGTDAYAISYCDEADRIYQAEVAF